MTLSKCSHNDKLIGLNLWPTLSALFSYLFHAFIACISVGVCLLFIFFKFDEIKMFIFITNLGARVGAMIFYCSQWYRPTLIYYILFWVRGVCVLVVKCFRFRFFVVVVWAKL